MTRFTSAVALIGLTVVLTVSLGACGRATPVHASFTVEGMHCESCSSAITEVLEKIDGVESASADHETGSAQAVLLSSSVDPNRLATEIESLGYIVTEVKTTPVEG